MGFQEGPFSVLEQERPSSQPNQNQHLDRIKKSHVDLTNLIAGIFFCRIVREERNWVTVRNLLLVERSRKPEIGGTQGGERGVSPFLLQNDPRKKILNLFLPT